MSISVAMLLLVVNAAGCSAADRRTRALPRGGSCERAPRPAWVLGANVIDHDDDEARGFGSNKSRTTLSRLVALGLDGVVLPVRLSTPGVSATTVSGGPLFGTTGEPRLLQMLADAHERQLFSVVVPHLLLDDGQWRGDLEPAFDGIASEAAWRAWFDSYTQLIVVLAETAERGCAGALSLGIEFKSLSQQPFAEAFMTELAGQVRQVFSGTLTYSANWDEVEFVPFWEAVDVVGINAFYPLTEKGGPGDGASLIRRAGEIHAALGTRFGARPVWFVELGLKSTARSFEEPWKWIAEVPDAALSERAQLEGYRAHAAALRAHDVVDGVFFWAVPADPDDRAHPFAFEDGRGFSFLDKPAEAVVRDLALDPPRR